jgi:putative ABC transport system permease protein
VPGPALTVYHPFDQETGGGRLFVHAATDPYALVTPITRVIRQLSAEQPVERAATLEDVRAEVLTADRLNTLVFSIFAGVALAIAVVGVAGVLAEGALMAALGVVAGAAGGWALARIAGSDIQNVEMPGIVPVAASAAVLLAAAVVASALPRRARRARRRAQRAARRISRANGTVYAGERLKGA